MLKKVKSDRASIYLKLVVVMLKKVKRDVILTRISKILSSQHVIQYKKLRNFTFFCSRYVFEAQCILYSQCTSIWITAMLNAHWATCDFLCVGQCGTGTISGIWQKHSKSL